MVKFKPQAESSLAHSSLFHKEPHAEPRAVGKADVRLGQRVSPYPAVILYIFCSFETEKDFLGRYAIQFVRKQGKNKDYKDQKILTYRRANVLRGKK